MTPALSLLREVFGFDAFRPGQEEIVEAVAAGRDTLAIMPTGGGKSLCFQLPAIMREGVTLVVSPLIALMRDQVRALRSAGVAAGAITSGNTSEETEAVHEALVAGRLKLLYLAPERLALNSTLSWLKRAGVSLIAVDEAHCVSQWGHDFRPDYLRIGELRRALDVPLAAFTATADEETRDEITMRLFGGEPPLSFLRGFDRPNIHLAFAVKDRPREQLLRFVDTRRGQAGIVYCATRARTETLATALREAGHSALYYHGGMEADARRTAEERFQREDGLIVAATVAFGMGVDKPDIRWVAHADLPKSIEGYYQEIGRAGRDGEPADTLTLYGADDIRMRRAQIDEGAAPPERKHADHGRLNALLGLAEAQACRRQVLLGFFGEDSAPCGNCDLCAAPPETFDATTEARMALSAALRTGESFGAAHLVAVLTGDANDRIRKLGHDSLPTFGVGRAHGRREWTAMLRQMMGQDLLRPDAARHGALRVMPAAHPVLRGEAVVQMRRDTLKSRPAPKVRAQVAEEDEGLLAALKARRRALAEAADVPAYVVFADRTLIEMATTRPATLDEMAQIHGVGAKKLQSYGQAFLDVIAQGASAPLHPARARLAGQGGSGALFDRLTKAQVELRHGLHGGERPMECSPRELARVAERRPRDESALARLIGPRHAERFGTAFLTILAEGG